MEIIEGQPAPYEIDHPFDGYGISEVIESRNAKFPVGTLVTSPSIKWEERSVVPASVTSGLTILPPEVRNSKIPLSAYIGVLGMHVSGTVECWNWCFGSPKTTLVDQVQGPSPPSCVPLCPDE